MEKSTILGKARAFLEIAKIETTIQYSQEAHCAFLTYLLVDEGLVSQEDKLDLFAILSAEGVGLVNHSQCKQWLTKQKVLTNGTDSPTARSLSKWGV